MSGAKFRSLRFAAGALAGLAVLVLPAEILIRLAPPSDVAPYLGAASGLSGPYVPDPVLGAGYRSPAGLAAQYPERLAQLAAENAGRPVWAMFGNSFVQAPGMLGDTAQARLPERQIFFLRRNEPVYLRVAQFRLLLGDGLRPERAFFVLLPVDFFGMAGNPIADVAVTPQGGLGRAVNGPPLLAALIGHSRLALAAWIRSGRSGLLPHFRSKDVLKPLPALLTGELDAMLGEIGRTARAHGVPVTIVFIPNREQIFGDPSTVPQDAITEAAARAGLDVIDTSAAFRAEENRAGLLIADGHLSARGNALLLSTILSHLDAGAGKAP